MLKIFLRTIKDRKISLTVYCIAGVLLLWMYVAISPSILDRAEEYQRIVEGYPEAMLKAFGIADIQLDTLEKFLALEQFALMWLLVAVFLLLSIAGSAISGEIEKGTVEILLSKSVSRLRIFFARYFAGVFALMLFTIFSIFSIFPITALHKVEIAALSYVPLAIISLLFGLTVFSMGMMFSALFSERGRTYMATGAVLIVMYFLNMISYLVEKLEPVRYFSFFYYFDSNKALIHGELNILSLVVFALIIAATTAIGALWFNKRDVAI